MGRIGECRNMRKCAQGCDAPVVANHPDWQQDDDMGLCKECFYGEMECKADELRLELSDVEQWLKANR